MHAGSTVTASELLRVPCDLDLAAAEDREEAERLYAEQAMAFRDALVGADTFTDALTGAEALIDAPAGIDAFTDALAGTEALTDAFTGAAAAADACVCVPVVPTEIEAPAGIGAVTWADVVADTGAGAEALAFRNECQEARQMVIFVDVTDETRPVGVSSWAVPERSGDFCGRGGRFGTHSSNESFAAVYYKRIMFFAHFNAGVRALDIRDPFRPSEIAYYIPAVTARTEKRCVGKGAEERCKTAIQTNNVEVDERGYIYAVDRANTGMHILRLTGAAREAMK